MSYNIKAFQNRYSLANKDIAEICKCSLPTIQKWRSGEVPVSGAAEQLMRLLDISADGNLAHFREVLGRINQSVDPTASPVDKDLENLESSMTEVVDRLEYMLESRRKDKQIAKSEARYRSMVEYYSNPVCRWLPDTTLTFANSAYCSLFFEEEQDIVGRLWIDFLPEEIRNSTMILVSDMVRRGQEETGMHEVIMLDGTVAVFEWQDIPIKDSTGRVVELHSIGYDVTELVELRGIRDQYALIKNAFFDLSPNPLAIMDGEGFFLETNRQFLSEIVAMHPVTSMSNLLSGPAVGKLKRLLRRINRNGVFNYRLEINGRAFRMNGRLIAEDKESKSRYLVRFEEISALKNQVAELRLGTEFVVDGTRRELDWDQEVISAISKRMNQLGHSVDVDRVYVFLIDWENDVFNNILEWCATGVESHIDDLQGFPISEYPWWVERMAKNQWITYEDTAKMPRSAYHERELLVAQGIRSIMVAPLIVEDKAAGFVGFDHNITQRVWHAQEQKSLEDFKEELEGLLGRL